MKNYYIAVDLGATSGRVMLASVEKTWIELEEIHRFANPIITRNGHQYWDLDGLFENILQGLTLVAERKVTIASIGIDTWGVDFVLFDQDGTKIQDPFSYRDPYTNDAPEAFFQRMSKEKLYGKTGIQIMPINTVFQLDTIQRTLPALHAQIGRVLFMPDALGYLLSGKQVTEYSIASTSGMIDPNTKTWDPEILDVLGLTPNHFAPIVFPGTVLGELLPQWQERTGLGPVPIISVAGHDTASSVAAVPALDSSFAYLSSGTWSLMGIETKEPIITEESYQENFTNEGGVDGSVRFLKNICGMWLLERCKAEWHDSSLTYDVLVKAAKSAVGQSQERPLIDPDDPCFANPPQMISAIQRYCQKTGQQIPLTYGEIALCIFESLAAKYAKVMKSLKVFSPHPINALYVVGGGSLNSYLNQLTASALNIDVITGSVEATAIGNVLLQAKALGVVKDIPAMRHLIAQSLQHQIIFSK